MKSLIALCWITAPVLCLAFGAIAVGEHHEQGDHQGHHEADQDGEPDWFDPAHCDVCRPMHERPDVMRVMTWDAHKLRAGMLMTTAVPAEKKADFYAVTESMHNDTLADEAKLCGFCKAFGKAIAAGAQVEEVKTDSGMITVVTATDPATIAKIHAVADRSIEEMAKMAAAE